MAGTSRLVTASAVGVLLVLVPVVAARAQSRTAAPVASSTGTIHGLVIDEAGAPVPGAMVSAVGAVTLFAVSEPNGKFELVSLPPGPYLVRAHRKGFTASRSQTIGVRSGERVAYSVDLRRADPKILAAGVGLVGAVGADPEPDGTAMPEPAPTASGDASERTETAWRIRHARRGILKDSDLATIVETESESRPFAAVDVLGRAVGSPARLATAFFAETPFSGQVNLLTTSSFDTPQQLFSGDNAARGTAYVRVGAPVGAQGDWAIRGAITEADLTAWLLAGSYKTRAPARHQYEFGMSYSTQRYDGGNPLALRDVADGSRNAGTVYAHDTFALAPALTIQYGGRYAQYDYLEHRTLVSPKLALTVSPASRTRLTAVVSSQAHAPGAEEFLPPGDTGIWLPPQRTFSALEAGRMLNAERTTQLALEVERDIAATTIAFRAFRQRVDDQLVTVFGAEVPSQPIAKIGHYLLANAGDVFAEGCSALLRTTITDRIQGTVAYSVATARMESPDTLRYLMLLAPSALRPASERIHDVATTIRADVPETSTRVLVLYRVSNAFARGDRNVEHGGFDSRFDVQVRQSLPFLDFSAARWEMLVAVRNFFREPTDDQSIYGELLTVRPPKRIVGGVTVHF
jgi:hypothetical protein